MLWAVSPLKIVLNCKVFIIYRLKQPITQIKRPHYQIWVIYPQVGNQLARDRIGLRFWLYSGYAHVFLLLSVVIGRHPNKKRRGESIAVNKRQPCLLWRLDVRGDSTAWTGVDTFAPLLPGVVPETDPRYRLVLATHVQWLSNPQFRIWRRPCSVMASFQQNLGGRPDRQPFLSTLEPFPSPGYTGTATELSAVDSRPTFI